MTVQLEYDVHPYDMQREGEAIVSGHQIKAHVTLPNGTQTPPVLVAVCTSKDDAEEICQLLNEKYKS